MKGETAMSSKWKDGDEWPLDMATPAFIGGGDPSDVVDALGPVEPDEEAAPSEDASVEKQREPMGRTFLEHAKAWVKSKGLLDKDADYDGMLGKAILRMAETFSAEGHSGMSAQLARAYFGFMCDAYDGMHSMLLNDTDYEKAKGALHKRIADTCDAIVELDKYDPDQPRDESGRFGSGGGGGGGGGEGSRRELMRPDGNVDIAAATRVATAVLDGRKSLEAFRTAASSLARDQRSTAGAREMRSTMQAAERTYRAMGSRVDQIARTAQNAGSHDVNYGTVQTMEGHVNRDYAAAGHALSAIQEAGTRYLGNG